MKQRLALAVGLLCSLLSTAGEKKEIYAHYMGCFPSYSGATTYHRNTLATNLVTQRDARYLTGGWIVNWPLTPQRGSVTSEQNAELEIRQALRAGLDGFVFDAWAGGEHAKKLFEVYLKTAERMKVPFRFTICFDPSCHPHDKPTVDAYVDTAKWVLRFKDSPNLARRNGKPLFFTYYAPHIVGPEKRPKDNLSATIENIGAAWADFRRKVGEDVYLHGCLAGLANLMIAEDGRNPLPRGVKSRAEQVGEWAGRTFDAVGGFIGNDAGGWGRNETLIQGVKKVGGVWAQPMFWQYDNKLGGIISGRGLDILRANWKSAIDHDSKLIQFVTWNDYGEETVLAPSYGTGYTITRVNRHYIDWWKSGKEPEIGRDEIHVVFRKYRVSSEPPDLTYPFGARMVKVPDYLEIVVFARKPARVTVPNYGVFNVPKGVTYRQFPIQPGRVSATLSRGWIFRETLALTVPEEITDRPWREDFTQFCHGTNFKKEWQKDFGAAEPLIYSEYGDADLDGLPNWFEMLHQGRFPFMDTAVQMEADADPDGDGKMNLAEFWEGTDPLRAHVPYAAGYVWDLMYTTNSRAMFNPIRDENGSPVWWLMYKFGAPRKIALDGDYLMCRLDDRAHLRKNVYTSYSNPHGGFASMGFDTDGAFRIGGKHEALLVLGWKSPISGQVDVDLNLRVGAGHGVVKLNLIKNASEVLASKQAKGKEKVTLSARDVRVEKGDFIYFIPEYRDAWGIGDCLISVFKIRCVAKD